MVKEKTKKISKDAKETPKEERVAGESKVPPRLFDLYKDKIIARGHNQVERLKDATAHAEMLTLTSASNYLGNKWLSQSSSGLFSLRYLSPHQRLWTSFQAAGMSGGCLCQE
jgi:tRNA(Arg) A34 adenosine deaminase TadA